MKKTFLFAITTILFFSCRNMIDDIDSIAGDNKAIISFSPIPITKTDNNGYNLKPYKINSYETTYFLWEEVLSWAEDNGFTFENKGKTGLSENTNLARFKPVTNITCSDCIVWCNAFSLKKGLEPCYYSDSSFSTVIKSLSESNLSSVKIKSDANGYRLPTKSEWVYAAYGTFATAQDKKYKYAGSDNIDEVAVYSSFKYGPSKVGTKKPNSIGCYDMTGNVSEICFTDGKAEAWGGHCQNEIKYLKLPADDLYGIVKLYPYLFGFRFVQTIN